MDNMRNIEGAIPLKGSISSAEAGFACRKMGANAELFPKGNDEASSYPACMLVRWKVETVARQNFMRNMFEVV